MQSTVLWIMQGQFLGNKTLPGPGALILFSELGRSLEQRCPIELSAMVEMPYICCGSVWQPWDTCGY